MCLTLAGGLFFFFSSSSSTVICTLSELLALKHHHPLVICWSNQKRGIKEEMIFLPCVSPQSKWISLYVATWLQCVKNLSSTLTDCF